MQYTTYYNLPQYEGSDKTAWLTVFNQAMLAIDTGIHGAKATADSASTLATTANNAATQASSDVTSLTNSLNTVIGNINTINSLIGNGTPTTTDQTIIGAINEINANVGNLTTNQGNLSSLTTTDKSSLVAAINEVAQGGGGGGGTHTYSTTEQIVGKWIDGTTDVYERTFDNLSVTNASHLDLIASNSGIAKIIDAYVNFTAVGYQESWYKVNREISTDRVYISFSEALTATDITAIIRYIKS